MSQSLSDTLKTKTTMWGTIAATIYIVPRWITALSGGSIDAQLIQETALAISALITLIFARRGILKSGPQR